MTWWGEAGLVLVGLALAVALAGLLLALPAALRARRASIETRRLVEMYRHTIELKVAEHSQLAAEQEALLRPLRALQRVVTHPLVVALFESYRLRRRRAREATL